MRRVHYLFRTLLRRILLAWQPHTYRVRVLYHKKHQRVDSYLSRVVPALSRGQVRELTRQARIRVNARRIPVDYRIRKGDTIDFRNVHDVPGPRMIALQIPVDIAFEDQSILVVNKQAGVLVHPNYNVLQANLVSELVASGKLERPVPFVFDHMIAHRLDRGTTGLVVIARTARALRRLRRQFKHRKVKKEYLAVVSGVPSADQGIIDQPIYKPVGSRRRVVEAQGKQSVTGYRVLERRGNYALVRLRLHTGRTHQIRVHLAWLGHPIAGDGLYGGPQVEEIDHQLLHAELLGFRHPHHGRWVEFRVPPPTDFMRFWDSLRKGSSNTV